MADQITYRQFHRLLLDLGFVEESVEDSHRCYRHSPSGTLIAFAWRPDDAMSRPSDIASVRRHLVENGLMEPQEFDRALSPSLTEHKRSECAAG